MDINSNKRRFLETIRLVEKRREFTKQENFQIVVDSNLNRASLSYQKSSNCLVKIKTLKEYIDHRDYIPVRERLNVQYRDLKFLLSPRKKTRSVAAEIQTRA